MRSESSPSGRAPPSEPLRREELAEVFRAREVPEHLFRVGAEGEKFGVNKESGHPLLYAKGTGICRVFEYLASAHDWSPVREHEDGPVIALKRDGASITLEPGAQLELSGAPLADLHAVAEEFSAHLRELQPISEELGIAWLSTGFHPTAQLKQLPWVPKTRYPIMRTYLPQKGSGALDMMQRTATVQANFDWSSENDAMRKLVVGLKLSPLIHALFVNAPFKEGKPSDKLSERGDVWLRMDPSRSGLIRPLWETHRPSYEDFVEWSLDAGMFMLWRDGGPIKNTGQSFRDFLMHGYQGYHATMEDWRLHLTTLFPEVRLKGTIEVRPLDAQAPDISMSALALWTGVLYEPQALAEAEAWTSDWSYEEVEGARTRLVAEGLDAPFLGRPHGWEHAERLLDLAADGLERRARGNLQHTSESIYLQPARQLVCRRESPATQALAAARATNSLISATSISPPPLS